MPRTAGGSETRGLPHSDPRSGDRRSRRTRRFAGRTTVGAMRYPEAPRLDLVEDLHGHRVADPYRWLEDDADPRTRAWSEAQDDLAREALSALPMRPHFAARLEQLVHAGAVGVPVWRGRPALPPPPAPGPGPPVPPGGAAPRPPPSASTPAATAAGWSSPAPPAPPRATTSGSAISPATATCAS